MPTTTPRTPRKKSAYERVRERIGSVDHITLLLVLMLITTGLIALYTASYVTAESKTGDPLYFISRQLGFAALGLVAMYFVSLVPYKTYYSLPTRVGRRIQIYHMLFVFCLVLLILVPFIGVESYNATRWINLPILGQFQPSELMKTSVILSFAWYASRPNSKIYTIWPGIFPYLGILGIVAILLALQPHLSATIIIAGIGMCILFVAGMRLVYIPVFLGLSVPAGIWYVLNNEYARDRIDSWLDPFIDLHDTGWQAANSHIAIGSGGFWGLGLGQGRQKHLFLPEPQNDFVFSAWCEEMGFVGAVLVIIMFTLLVFRAFYIARQAPDRLSCLIATGIAAKLAIQTLLNLFVVTGLFPVTGASLPFFSYGGTALLIQFGEMGILLNISRNMRHRE